MSEKLRWCFLVFIAGCTVCTTSSIQADDFGKLIRPVLVKNCVKCHGGKKVSGEINFAAIRNERQFLGKPELIKQMIDAVDANDMPPENAPSLSPKTRAHLLASLKLMLRRATSNRSPKKARFQRLNRFQYNNSVRDLFQLNRDVFRLPEKLMTRNDRYLLNNKGRMPARVNVVSHSLSPPVGLRNVKAFPKDLRANHGFDNQADRLTLSPLLLDAYLRLSVSIVESPDFNKNSVGIWDEFFAEPKSKDKRAEVHRRLQRFLQMAFRGPVEPATLNRYLTYTLKKLDSGTPFTQTMKKVASAALSSPMFLLRRALPSGPSNQYELASNLSFFLWSSGPDQELLRLAGRGELAKRGVLEKTIDRMLADPKIERFLDTFPTQWMQLENALAITPDPGTNRYFSLDRRRPASLQMVLEPLLLFDAVFIEDRPVVELIAPPFSYRSEFLKTWYESELRPPPVNEAQVRKINRANRDRKQALLKQQTDRQKQLGELVNPVKAAILAERNRGTKKKPVDLQPYAAWEFDGNLKESVRGLHLRAHGKVRFEDGMAVLNRSFLLSKPLPVDLRAKSLEVWCKVPNLDQRGGGVMGIQGPGDFFDTIVIGERRNRHWISGSNGFSRTLDFPRSTPETKVNQMLHLMMVYEPNGTTRLYRDGKPYGGPFRKGSAVFPRNRSSVIFGLRHLPAGGNKYLNVTIDRARLYTRALTAGEVSAAYSGKNLYVSQKQLLSAFTQQQKEKWSRLRKELQDLRTAISKVPPQRDINVLRRTAQQRYDAEIRRQLVSTSFDRVPASDPRYGGVITNAAMLSMTSGPKRTHPIARGAWIIEVIFNDPPPPPPNDVPPLREEDSKKNLTIRERFAEHRKNPSCAGCHSRIDPLGFALENFDITGRWRAKYANGRPVDAGGILMRKHKFDGVVRFKKALVKEKRRFAKSFTAHMLRYALARELEPADALTLDDITTRTEKADFKLKSIIREVIRSQAFSRVTR